MSLNHICEEEAVIFSATYEDRTFVKITMLFDSDCGNMIYMTVRLADGMHFFVKIYPNIIHQL